MKKSLGLIILLLIIQYSYSQYASSGTGKYIDQIFWLKFSPAEDGVGLVSWPNQSSYVFSETTSLLVGQYIWMINPMVRVVANISNLTGDLLPIPTTNYWANGLQYMYSDVNPIMLGTSYGGTSTFDITIHLQTKNGNTWTSVINQNQGVVIADAESFAFDAEEMFPLPYEHIKADIPRNSNWYLIDVPTEPSGGDPLRNEHYIVNISENIANNTKTLLMYVDDDVASDKGHASVFYVKGLNALTNVSQKGGGSTGLSMGFFIPTKISTAPLSYGYAYHLQEQMDLGDIVPLDGANTISSILTGYEGSLPNLSSNTITKFIESSLQYPDKYFIDGPELSLDIDISTLNHDNEDAFIYAWIDINGDGIFSGNEYVRYIVPAQTNNETFTITFPKEWFEGTTAKNTYFRLRITTDELENINLDPNIVDSRSYDYASNGDVIDREIRLTYTTLPLTILQIDVHQIQNKNIIRWETTHETNTSHFEIEKSINGISGWISIGKVQAINQAVISHWYEFIDASQSSISHYYRLKQVDIDGTYSYSKIIHAKKNQIEKSIFIYPQPFQQKVHVRMNVITNGEYQFEIYSIEGKKISSQKKLLSKGIQNIELTPTSFLSKGNYIIQILHKNQPIYSGILLKQ